VERNLDIAVEQTFLIHAQQCRYVLGDSTAKPQSKPAGLVLLASAPPAGNGSLVGRTMRKRPLFSIRLTWSALTLSAVLSADIIILSERQAYGACHLNHGLLPQCNVVAIEQSFSGRLSSHRNDSQASIVYQHPLCAEHMLCFLVSVHGDTAACANAEIEPCSTLQGLHYTLIQQVTLTLQGDVHVT